MYISTCCISGICLILHMKISRVIKKNKLREWLRTKLKLLIALKNSVMMIYHQVGCLNIKMPSCWYEDFHYKDKTVSQTYHLCNGIPCTWSLYLEVSRFMSYNLQWFIRDLQCPISIWRPYFRYRDFNYKNKTVVRMSYLYIGNPCTGKMTSFDWDSPLKPIMDCIID